VRKPAPGSPGAGRRRVAAVLVLAALLITVAAVPAQAHPAGFQSAGDFRTGVTGLLPTIRGVQARFVPDGSRLELRNTTAGTVEVTGDAGEPMLQVRPDGVWANLASPAATGSLGLAADGPQRDAKTPVWQRISATPLARWQDQRVLWHDGLPPTARIEPGLVHRLRNWRIPIHGDGWAAQIAGTLDWVPPPDPAPWWIATLLLAGVLALCGWQTGPVSATATLTAARLATRLGPPAAGLLTGVAVVWYWIAIALCSAEPGGWSRVLAVLGQAPPILLGLGLLAGAAAGVAGRAVALPVLGLCGGAVALLVGADNTDVYGHAVLPVPVNGWCGRLAELAVLGAGTGLAAGGLLRLARHRRRFDAARHRGRVDAAR
jgi:hypothetical protein